MATAKKKTAAKQPAAKKTAAKKTAAKKQPLAPEPAPGELPDLAALLRVRAQLLAYALSLPGAWEDHPWGESVAKAGKKVFAFLGTTDPAYLHKGIGMSVKLPHSGDLVLSLPFAEPTGYGLGRAGWVSVYLQPADLPPFPMLAAWIDESFRAVAPKKQIAELDALRARA
jgi:predicted DNA-binding protein (MmcQ/YjbR family)